MSNLTSDSSREIAKFRPIYYFGWLLFRFLGKVCGMKYRGAEHMPSSGPFILAANHQHALDPFLLGAWNRRLVHFFAKKELWKNPKVGWLISRMNAFPVKRGTIDRSAFSTAAQIFRMGRGLVFFPEGTRGTGKEFLPPKPGLGMLIKQCKITVPIIPVYVQGTNQLGKCFWRKKQLAIIIGQPIPVAEVDKYLENKAGYQALSELIMERIGELKQQCLEEKL